MAAFVDAMEVFERTVVASCRERGYGRRYTPVEIDRIVRGAVEDFAGSLEELAGYIEREDWEGLCALARQTETLRAMGRRV